MTFTQAVCPNRWNEMFPERLIDPNDPKYHTEPGDPSGAPCCFCKTPSRIYIRIDPAMVPFPNLEDDS